MDEVPSVSHGPAKAVQGVDHDHVPGSGVAHCFLKSWTIRGRPGLLVHVNGLGLDAGTPQGVQLAGKVLLLVETLAYPIFISEPYRKLSLQQGLIA
ncbi:hypothetical protein StoSoilB20_01540 [Arthrobacter sp. StoSoilB20]|nr:hypothetical protein StoSoilB20_01540 [Arthrobacter sp. StoSoilB20]